MLELTRGVADREAAKRHGWRRPSTAPWPSCPSPSGRPFGPTPPTSRRPGQIRCLPPGSATSHGLRQLAPLTASASASHAEPSCRSTGRATSGYDVGEPGTEVSVYASTISYSNRSPWSRPEIYYVRAEVNESPSALAIDALSQVKHVLLPITDRNPYLPEGTRHAAATTTSLEKKYGASITVVVIDDKPKESFPEHDTQMSSIRWHLSEGENRFICLF
ncbi:hypothetical protein ZWY2020_050377 [Hordeum vulgare]|nr:hypothetical protein ZWY2020_050377 [Hordeum vulgare]